MFVEYCNDRFDTLIRKKGNYLQNYYECPFPKVARCLQYYYVEIIRIHDSNKTVGRIQFIEHGERNRKGSTMFYRKHI